MSLACFMAPRVTDSVMMMTNDAPGDLAADFLTTVLSASQALFNCVASTVYVV
jgi:hypothetical protein